MLKLILDEFSISQLKIKSCAQPATPHSGCQHLGVWFQSPVKWMPLQVNTDFQASCSSVWEWWRIHAHTVDREIFVAKIFCWQKLDAQNSLTLNNIAELMMPHVLWRSDEVRMALLRHMKFIRGLFQLWIALFLLRDKQHTTTYSSVCCLHILHMHSTLALRLSCNLIVGSLIFVVCSSDKNSTHISGLTEGENQFLTPSHMHSGIISYNQITKQSSKLVLLWQGECM